MRKIILILLNILILNASQMTNNEPLSLQRALEILNSNNLEIKAASIDVNSAKAKADSVSGTHWGKLDFVQDFANSNDAGNVFGFKLTSREATFGDFGAGEFMSSMDPSSPNYVAGGDYTTPPQDLNYPEARNFFQSKLKYEIPLFTGFQISSYSDIMNSMTKMKSLDKDKVINEKEYELRKSYFDMALLSNSMRNLETILENIIKLEHMTKSMIEVGYAKRVDILEVQAKKGNVERLISQMQYNQKLLYHYISFLLNDEVTSIEIPTTNVEMPNFSDEDILAKNIDIQRATTGLEVRRSMTDVSKSAYYPMIGAFGEVATADDSFLGDANDHMAYTVGARLTWNVFNGGIDSSKIEEAKLNQLKTASMIQLAKHGIKLKIAKIRTEIETYDSEVDSLQKELKLSNEIYKNYEGRYKEKLSSMSDVIIKQSEQIQKVLQLQQALNKRNERIFALEKLANGDK